MEKREPKNLNVYDKRFENDPSSFNDFQAMDYVRELKNQGRTDDAIEVGRTFLQVGENLKSFINYYGYALYNKYINIDDEQISQKEDLFFSVVEDIVALCKQEKFSPLESTINRAIKYVLNKKPVDYQKVSDLLDKINPLETRNDPFKSQTGREFESKREKWYRLKVRCCYELKEYTQCVENANIAFTQPIKWHHNNQNWIKYYRASSLVQLKRYEEAENEFMALGHKIPLGNAFDVLFDLYMNTGKEKEAYTQLLYQFFISGYDVQQLPIYQKVLDMIKTNDSQAELLALAQSFIYKLKEESQLNIENDVLDAQYQDTDSSSLYDRFYNKLMDHLDVYIDRYEGRIVYYQNDKEYGSIYQEDDDNLFFRQADYIYDEEVKKRDTVEYSIMKTYDMKKQRVTTKAILIKTLYEDIQY